MEQQPQRRVKRVIINDMDDFNNNTIMEQPRHRGKRVIIINDTDENDVNDDNNNNENNNENNKGVDNCRNVEIQTALKSDDINKLYDALDNMVSRIEKFDCKIHKYNKKYKKQYAELSQLSNNMNITLCVALFVVAVVINISGMITIGELI